MNKTRISLKASHFIPIYGSFIYFKEYFGADRRDIDEAVQASWMMIYHSFSPAVSVLLIIKLMLLWGV
jgi:hypothetical protein